MQIQIQLLGPSVVDPGPVVFSLPGSEIRIRIFFTDSDPNRIRSYWPDNLYMLENSFSFLIT